MPSEVHALIESCPGKTNIAPRLCFASEKITSLIIEEVFVASPPASFLFIEAALSKIFLISG